MRKNVFCVDRSRIDDKELFSPIGLLLLFKQGIKSKLKWRKDKILCAIRRLINNCSCTSVNYLRDYLSNIGLKQGFSNCGSRPQVGPGALSRGSRQCFLQIHYYCNNQRYSVHKYIILPTLSNDFVTIMRSTISKQCSSCC